MENFTRDVGHKIKRIQLLSYYSKRFFLWLVKTVDCFETFVHLLQLLFIGA